VRDAISKIPEQYHPVVFKSKVVSRTHGCFKVDDQGNWFLKDVKSSSGTFLNHQRLSSASTTSKDYLLHDGDIIQLGMDFRGGTE
ncbi:FHA domain-containing protein, partial [Roseburia hominis]|nr:FHA domain-containing protein [Roseburia hominis]